MLIKYLKIDQQKNKIDTCTPKSSTICTSPSKQEARGVLKPCLT